MFVRNVLITGANRGLGLEFVKQLVVLSEPPLNLFATCRTPGTGKAKELQELSVANPRVKVLQLDVTDESSIVRAVEHVKKAVGNDGLNLLINNAGITTKGVTYDSVQASSAMNVLATNTVGPLLTTKAFLPLLRMASSKDTSHGMSCGRAAIINISSTLGSIELEKGGGPFVYNMSKAALNMLTKSMSCDLRKDDIMVVALDPTWTVTDLGGPRAPLSAEKSVEGMLNVMTTLNETHTGQFIDYTGKNLPW
ncbi:C-signal-like [Ptychodera flava]|uniref:C-signal-like n=1 Tax=Ptychodera flava TaxID=63121 RepID=UPI00396A8D90